VKNKPAHNSNAWHNGGVGKDLTGWNVFINFGCCLTGTDYKYRHLCQAANRYQQGERKDRDNENDRQNGLRMKNEMTMKEKRFSFFADTHLVHCLLPDTRANASQKSKSQIFRHSIFVCN